MINTEASQRFNQVKQRMLRLELERQLDKSITLAWSNYWLHITKECSQCKIAANHNLCDTGFSLRDIWNRLTKKG